MSSNCEPMKLWILKRVKEKMGKKILYIICMEKDCFYSFQIMSI